MSPEDTKWTSRVAERVKGVEFCFPKDHNNPAPGCYCVIGPTTEYMMSKHSIAHAAMLFLANHCGDEEAKEAAHALMR